MTAKIYLRIFDYAVDIISDAIASFSRLHHSAVLPISSVIYRLLRCEYDIFYLVAYQEHIYAILAILEAFVESSVEDDISRYQFHTRARKVSSYRRRDAVLLLMMKMLVDLIQSVVLQLNLGVTIVEGVGVAYGDCIG